VWLPRHAPGQRRPAEGRSRRRVDGKAGGRARPSRAGPMRGCTMACRPGRGLCSSRVNATPTAGSGRVRCVFELVGRRVGRRDSGCQTDDVSDATRRSGTSARPSVAFVASLSTTSSWFRRGAASKLRRSCVEAASKLAEDYSTPTRGGTSASPRRATRPGNMSHVSSAGAGDVPVQFVGRWRSRPLGTTSDPT
jgi:hypothetical protein